MWYLYRELVDSVGMAHYYNSLNIQSGLKSHKYNSFKAHNLLYEM